MTAPALELGLDVPRTLEVGRAYVAIGPAEGSKLGPPPRILVVAELEDCYRVEGRGQVSPFVLKGCERFWRLA